MNYMEEIFLRADIQQIREFLLHGVEGGDIDPRPYEERLESALKHVTDKLCESFPEEQEHEKMLQLVYKCVASFEDVYMEVGLQIGAILAAQVCQNMKTAFKGE